MDVVSRRTEFITNTTLHGVGLTTRLSFQSGLLRGLPFSPQVSSSEEGNDAASLASGVGPQRKECGGFRECSSWRNYKPSFRTYYPIWSSVSSTNAQACSTFPYVHRFFLVFSSLPPTSYQSSARICTDRLTPRETSI